MNFLTAKIPDTDSSDEDYIPPSNPSSSNALSIRKKRPQPISEFDDDDDDDDDDDVGDEDEGEEEEDGVINEDAHEKQAQVARSTGSVRPSSAGAAGASSSTGAGAPSSANAGASLSSGVGKALARGEGSSSAGAVGASSVGNVAGGATDVHVASLKARDGSNSMIAPTRNTNISEDGVEPIPETGIVDAAQSSGGEGVKDDGGKAIIGAETSSIENESVGKEVGEKGEEPSVPGAKIVKEERVVEHAGQDGRKGEVRVVKKRRVEENQTKSEIDDIWADMNRSTKGGVVKKEKEKDDAALMGWLGGSSVKRESKPLKVKLLGDLEGEVKEKERIEERRKTLEEKRPRHTGLEAVLNAVKGAKKEGVLTETREVWDDFKSKDEEVEAELEAYKKDKGRYTDRVAFLEKSDVRQWEYEQANKRTRR